MTALNNREFDLVAAGCRWPHKASDTAILRDLACGPLDWEKVLRIARRQRVEGLFYRVLSKAGIALAAEIDRQLAQGAATQARQALLLAVETARLQRLFAETGLTLLCLKGAPIAMLAYGDLGLRHAKDIDLMVAPASLEAASAVLRQAGYRRRTPPEPVAPDQYPLWLRLAASIEWRHDRSGAEVELHWKAPETLGMPSLDSVPLQTVLVPPGQPVRVLDTDHLLAYLCLHGGAHGWCRLKWLADVHTLLLSQVNDKGRSLETIYEELERLGAKWPGGQALLLCESVFHLPLPGPLAHRLRRSLRLRLLHAVARQAMLSGGGEIEIYDVPLATGRIYLSRFLLREGLPALRFEAQQIFFPPDQVLASGIPARWVALFPFARLALWARKQWRLRLAKPPRQVLPG